MQLKVDFMKLKIVLQIAFMRFAGLFLLNYTKIQLFLWLELQNILMYDIIIITGNFRSLYDYLWILQRYAHLRACYGDTFERTKLV